ncbi:MAG: DegV family protein [Desulfitobacteriaceae bacterium]
MSLVVLVDSSADIPYERAKAAGIDVVPMPVIIGENAFLEGVDLLPEDFYARFRSFSELPKTSQPNPQTLLQHYEKILAEGNEVVALHLSSQLSATYATALMIRDMCSAPEKVHIVDSRGASFGFGLLALMISERIREVSSWEEAEPFVVEMRDHMRYIFTPDTLEYLAKGGRVSKTAGLVGNLLDLKPLLHVTSEGKIEAFGKVRSRRSALHRLIDVMEAEIVSPEQQIVGVAHSDCLAEASALAEEIRRRIPVKDIWFSYIGCVIGSHTGPGTLALFYQR